MQMQRVSAQAGSARVARRAAVPVRAKASAAVSTATKIVVKEHGSVSLRGTVRKVNEDRFDVKVRGKGGDGGTAAVAFSTATAAAPSLQGLQCSVI